MIFAQILTGQRRESVDLCWVIMSFFVSRFWNSYVTETHSAVWRSGSEWRR